MLIKNGNSGTYQLSKFSLKIIPIRLSLTHNLLNTPCSTFPQTYPHKNYSSRLYHRADLNNFFEKVWVRFYFSFYFFTGVNNCRMVTTA